MSILRATRAPNLINAPQQYESRHHDQIYRELRVYFNVLDNATSALFGPRGGDYLTFSYGSFYDTTDQTAADTTTAYAVTLNTTDISQGVSIENSSQITVAEAGIYNLQFSIQFVNANANAQDTSVWLRQNGVDVPASNGDSSIPAKHGSTNGKLIVAWNYFLTAAAGDFFELMWSTDSSDISIQYIDAQTSPTRPVTPSVILTVTRVSDVTSDVYA